MVDINNKINKKYVLDFDSVEKEKIYKELKQTFSTKCQNNPTFSDEYKAHISNLDNIKVEIKYERRVELYFNTIEYKVHYETKESYKETSGYTATIKTDMYGNKEVTNIRENSNWNTYTMEHNQKITLFSTEFSPLIISRGSGTKVENPQKRYFKRSLDDPTLPQTLINIFSDEVTKPIINDMVKSTVGNEGYAIYGKAEKYIYEVLHHKPIGKIEFLEVEDYRLDYIDIYYVPYWFKVYTVFNGKTYICGYAIDLSKEYDYGVCEEGEVSEKYNAFLDACSIYNGERSIIASIISICSIIFCVSPLILSWLSILLSFLDGVVKRYNFPLSILTFLGSVLITLFDIAIYSTLAFNASEIPYNPDNTIEENKMLIKQKCEEEKKSSIGLSVIFSILCCVATLFLWYI